MTSLELKTTTVFSKTRDALLDAKIRFIIEQGGSRSSKTFSIMQMIIVHCLTEANQCVSIVRKSFPSLRGSVMREFFDLMKSLDLYKVKNHNKTENIYTFPNGSIVEFFAVDDPQKLRGRKRDILYANEANELNYEEFTQLNLRTSTKLIFDFNPSESFHWLYDLIARPESILIHSTYHDNPFLTAAQIQEMEYLKNVDENYYRVYALGEKGIGKTTIYSHWKFYTEEPETKETIYGLDFGFNVPTSLLQVDIIDNKFYTKELIYRQGMTSNDLVAEMNRIQVSKKSEIICDSARPEIIEDLKRAGYNAKTAIKDVKDGIDSVKSSELFIHKESLNIHKELTAYKWKTNGDIILDEPVKIWDHACDALRYAIHYYKQKNKRANSNFFKIHF
jgi:phage terminase large subunit